MRGAKALEVLYDNTFCLHNFEDLEHKTPLEDLHFLYAENL